MHSKIHSSVQSKLLAVKMYLRTHSSTQVKICSLEKCFQETNNYIFGIAHIKWHPSLQLESCWLPWRIQETKNNSNVIQARNWKVACYQNAFKELKKHARFVTQANTRNSLTMSSWAALLLNFSCNPCFQTGRRLGGLKVSRSLA